VIKFKLNLFYKELVLFGLTLFLGLFSAVRLLGQNPFLNQKAEFKLQDFIVLAIFVIILLLLRRKKKAIGIIYKIFLLLVVVSGSQIIFNSFVAYPLDILLTLLLVVFFLFCPNVLTHNLAIIFGIAGIGTVVGLGVTPTTALFLLIVLSFYDIVAVYKTRHMVEMAKGMVESGAIFGFVIPSKISNLFSHRDEARSKIGLTAQADGEFMILGSGDIGLPLIMVCSLVPISLSAALVTAAFSLVGLLATHLIFVNQSQRRPMAALPPIATMTIIGYLITLI